MNKFFTFIAAFVCLFSIETTTFAQELVPIASLKAVDADGISTSIDEIIEIRGIVYGPNYRPQGLQFILIDDTGGMNVFSQNENFGYVVTEGDELSIVGTVAQFRGLTEVEPQSIEVLSSGNPLAAPRTVNTLDESTESEFIRLECLSLIDPTQWNPGNGGGFSIEVTNGETEFQVRVDNAIDLFEQEEAPNGIFNLTGFGWQFDNAEPLLEGYQIYARSAADVELVSPPANFTSFGATNFITFLADLSPDIIRYDWDFGDGTMVSLPNGTTNHFFEEDGFYNVCLTVYSEGLCGEVSSSVCNTVLIGEAPPEFPIYDIAQVTGISAEGVADSVDAQCELRGVVHSVNFSGNGLQFVLIDPTDGIVVNRGGGGPNGGNLGYAVMEGDSIHVIGTVDQNQGLTVIDVDSLAVVDGGHPLKEAGIVTELNESTESDLVKFECMYLENPEQWGAVGGGGGGSFTVDVTDGTNIIEVRVDTDTDLFDTEAPVGVFNITGLGWQAAGGNPQNADLLASYLLYPRYTADIEPVLALDPSFEFTVDGNMVSFSANDTNNATAITWDFGDSNTSNEASINYEYSSVAEYEVCLTLTGESSCGETSVTSCQTIDLVPIPVYDIAEIKGIDATGVLDSIDVACELRGVVHSPNFRPQGLQFTMEDETGAIFVFSFNDNLGYEVQMGDSIHIVGTIAQFRGTSIITPANISVISSNNNLHAPKLTTGLSEEVEGDLIQINCLRLEDPTEWGAGGGGGSFNVNVTNGVETFTMRIDADTDLAGTDAPTSSFNVLGVVFQNAGNNAADLLGDYQLYPRFVDDLMELVPVSADFTFGIDEGTVNLVADAPEGEVVSYLWNMGDGSVEVTTEPNLLYTYGENGDFLVTLTVTADDGCATMSNSTQEISVVLVGIEEVIAEKFNVQLFPNPAKNTLTISANEHISQISFLNILGQEVLTISTKQASKMDLDIRSLQSGVYFVRALIGEEWALQRLVIE